MNYDDKGKIGSLAAGADLYGKESEVEMFSPLPEDLQAWAKDNFYGSDADATEFKKALATAFIIMNNEGCAPQGLAGTPRSIALQTDYGVEKQRLYNRASNGEITMGKVLASLADRAVAGTLVAIENFAMGAAPKMVETASNFIESTFNITIPEPVKHFARTVAPELVARTANWLNRVVRPKVVEVVYHIGNWISNVATTTINTFVRVCNAIFS